MMKKLLFLSGFIGITGFSWAQDLSVDDLLSFSSMPSKKFDNYISKKGFKPFGMDFRNDTIVHNWQQTGKNPDTTQAPIVRKVSRYQNGKEFAFCMETSSRGEYLSAIAGLKAEGFSCGNIINSTDTFLLFQKTNYTVETSSYMEDSLCYYSLVFRKKPLPSANDILYANDLLQFDSHEYLAGFFGRKNVKNDFYYFSETEISKCSVLYPNTARQAVFIWEDEQNMRGLARVIISGSFPTAGSAGFSQQVVENSWLLNDGLHFNMRLDELVQLNGKDISFYGTNTARPLMVLPGKTGNINLSNTTLILDCINCEGSSLLHQKTINAYEALDNSLRLHIGMIILTPSIGTGRE